MMADQDRQGKIGRKAADKLRQCLNAAPRGPDRHDSEPATIDNHFPNAPLPGFDMRLIAFPEQADRLAYVES